MNKTNHIKFLKINLSRTLMLKSQIKNGVILRSDRDAPCTSKAFIEYCESVNVIRSMSKAGSLYINAPMEHYFNILKCKSENLYEFTTEKVLD